MFDNYLHRFQGYALLLRYLMFIYEDFRATPLCCDIWCLSTKMSGLRPSVAISDVYLRRFQGYAPLLRYLMFIYEDVRATPLIRSSVFLALRRFQVYATCVSISDIYLWRCEIMLLLLRKFKFYGIFYNGLRSVALKSSWQYVRRGSREGRSPEIFVAICST
jgi:hypothetical protein